MFDKLKTTEELIAYHNDAAEEFSETAQRRRQSYELHPEDDDFKIQADEAENAAEWHRETAQHLATLAMRYAEAEYNLKSLLSIPELMLDAARLVGKVEWAAGTGTDEEHGQRMTVALQKTREHFKLPDGPREFHFVCNKDSTLAFIGTSPNSGEISKTIVALWNWLVDRAAEKGPKND